MSDHPPSCDVVIVGAGAAGLHVALEVAEMGAQACLISRKPLSETSSFRAQGGLAAAIGPGDSPTLHAADTAAAGRAACRPSAVSALVEEAPAAVELLGRRGVRFDTGENGGLALGLEGGHSARRIVHARGAETGQEITSRLAALAAREPMITVSENRSVIQLLSDGSSCAGVLTDQGPIRAAATVLATGGAAALWERTTNPWGAIGAGPVLAHAAGADLADLELCQFHPTALALPGSPLDGSLITEAVRGEGALLLDASGHRFTDELAPRDVVSVAIRAQMEGEGTDSVGLDLRPVDLSRFGAIVRMLREAGLDPADATVPVSPAAHYTMGGVATDIEGRSSLAGLFAVGECACNGLHGANRLASNSLSECFVFGTRAARAIRSAEAESESESESGEPIEPSDWRFVPPTVETRAAVWRYAGPTRDEAGLSVLLDDPYPLAALTARSALARRESRGPHIRSDYPDLDARLDGIHVVIGPDGEPRLEHWS